MQIRASIKLFFMICVFISTSGTTVATDIKNSMVVSDFRNLYNISKLPAFSLIFITAGVMANTTIDRDIRNFYQSDVRDNFTNDLASFFKNFGNRPEGYAYISFGLISSTFKLYEKNIIFNWGNSVLRTIIIGEPIVFALQKILGPTRPRINPQTGSIWHPFNRWHNNVGASGHAFMGAIPFLTAAELSDNQVLKLIFYLLSTATGLSRINDDAHFSSQVLLGYSIAYLAVKSVMQTNQEKFLIVPNYNKKNNSYGLELVVTF